MEYIRVVKVLSDCILTMILCAFKFRLSVFAVKFFVFANFVVCFFLSCSLFYVRIHWRCNESWHYVIQLLGSLCNDCFKLKHLFLLSAFG